MSTDDDLAALERIVRVHSGLGAYETVSLAEALRAAGWTSPAEAERLRAENQRLLCGEADVLRHEIAGLRTENQRLRVWHCTVDGRTSPCGDCSGCRQMYAEWRVESDDLAAKVAETIAMLREQQRVAAELIPGEVVLIEVSRVLNSLGEQVRP